MRIVVKVGTSTLAYSTGRLNIRRVEALSRVLSDLKNAGHEIVLVSSGAIGMGTGRLGFRERPKDMPSKQAAAAVGQCELMYVYDRLFSGYNHITAQILLTAEDLRDDKRHDNFTNTILRLLELGVLPVINENDTVSTEEIAFGDNDTLGALAAISVRADLLIILTDIDSLYTADPRRDAHVERIAEVTELTPEILSAAGGQGSALSTGGMVTKLGAARLCMEAGIDMVIADGSRPELLYDAADGKNVGTRFRGKKTN